MTETTRTKTKKMKKLVKMRNKKTTKVKLLKMMNKKTKKIKLLKTLNKMSPKKNPYKFLLKTSSLGSLAFSVQNSLNSFSQPSGHTKELIS
jgi:hypothetical protein